MNKQMSISIGIPAFNEEANIKKLLQSVLRQKEKNFYLKEVIVILDGCTDNTAKKVKELHDERIFLYEGLNRIGKSARLNQIFETCSGDVLILMDADIQLPDNNVFSKIINHSDMGIDGIAGVNITPLRPENYFDHIMEAGIFITKEIRAQWNSGINYLAFPGALLILDKWLVKSVKLPYSLINNDAFLYLSAIEKGYRTRYISEVSVNYKSPSGLSDYLKQSLRYKTSAVEISKYFNINLNDHYRIPFSLSLLTALKYLFLMPQYTIPYLFIKAYARFKKAAPITNLWDIAVSTKGV